MDPVQLMKAVKTPVELENMRKTHIKDGVAVDYSEEQATRILSEPEVTAIADVKMGEAEATA